MSEVHQAAAAAHQGRQQQLLRQKMMEAKERLAALEAAVAAKQQASLTTDNLVKPTLKEPSGKECCVRRVQHNRARLDGA